MTNKDSTPGPNLIPPRGGYRGLKSYQNAEIVYDATVRFCDKFVERRSRTHDQMVQAARSGKQNIGEGSMASGTSKKTELKLVGVARASLEEPVARLPRLFAPAQTGGLGKEPSDGASCAETRLFRK
jgi:four helix bundle protein